MKTESARAYEVFGAGGSDTPSELVTVVVTHPTLPVTDPAFRSVVLPASMTLLGDWNWWLPGFLRWLPRVTIEGEPQARPAHDAPAPST